MARARLLGLSACDESSLDQLDAELFSPARRLEAAVALSGARASPDAASARARLALTYELGALSHLRPIERALARARASGRLEEALAIAEDRQRRLAAEAEGTPGSRLVEMAARVRAVDMRLLADQARSLLEITRPLTERMQGRARSCRAEATAGTPAAQASAAGASPSTFEGRVNRLSGAETALASKLPGSSAAAAVRELASGLGLDTDCTLEVAFLGTASNVGNGAGTTPKATVGADVRIESPRLLEEDPPRSVSLLVPDRSGYGALASALAAAAPALLAAHRSSALPAEHRFWSDPALGFAFGCLFASIARVHRSVRSTAESVRRLDLFRELLGARLAAASFIARHELLSSLRSRSDSEATEEAALQRPGFIVLPLEEESILDPADRFRGFLLLAGLRERFRTRFGNLWYREKAAGNLVREAAEPGGSVVTSELASGLSIPAGSPEWLVDSWQQEERRLR